MKKMIIGSLTSLGLLLSVGCAQGDTAMTDKSLTPCGDKPNCVSTLDERKDYQLAPFTLVSDDVTISQIIEVALTLPGSRSGDRAKDYARIESVSSVFRFVDDLELRIDGDNLIVRSESRVGYSDFSANRKRAEALRQSLKEAGLIL
ncbi:DUF1499 domain-containing protein [Enterovibrio norvegicus]|uniref:DUF1499 domain-containing protein n=1 Tax=Enterovibrio norvegicus TaxID=188144 RepID=UPI000C82166C|nr:DUF1499 domain-containing protein [Enterovibrio norvegicus]PML77962.1 hypothetical protein BCT69_17385 [Enterovibrio norvegicus]